MNKTSKGFYDFKLTNASGALNLLNENPLLSVWDSNFELWIFPNKCYERRFSMEQPVYHQEIDK